MSGKFILIPTPLGDLNTDTLPQYVVAHIHQLDTFIAERAKTARHIVKVTQPHLRDGLLPILMNGQVRVE